MSYWSHNPGLLDEILADEFYRRVNNAPGDCIINFSWNTDIDYNWISKKFGEDFADSILTDAKADYWSSLMDKP